MVWVEFREDLIINSDVLETIRLTVYGEDHYDKGKWIIKMLVANTEEPYVWEFGSQQEARKKYEEIKSILIKK